MKLMKSILLGSAAGLVAAASAQAADLPTKKAAPAEYVKVCNAYGVGFFYIPGTDTCLRIGGFVRAEYAWMNSRNTINPGTNGVVPAAVSAKAIDQTGFRARGRLQFDARTQTAWGTLRAFGRFDFTSDAGIYKNGNAIGTGNTSNYVSVRYIFVQWAGITAGQAQSFFDFYADAINWERMRGSDTYMPLLAYTATFGGGFSATLALEDRSKRMANTNGVLNGGVSYAGYRAPDIVANLRVDQAWGSAQLSGALHHVNTVLGSGVGAPSTDKWGYAVQAGVMFNLPQLAAGDQLWLQASYAKGALDYVGVGTANQGNVTGGYLGRFHGGLLRNDTDAWAYACGVGSYCLDLSTGWSITAGLRHFWAPNFRQDIYGSYLNVKPGSNQRLTDWTFGGLGKAQEYTVGTTFTWIPVSGFEIGLDLVYSKLRQDLAGGAGGIAPTALPADVKKDPDTYQARLRFQRAF